MNKKINLLITGGAGFIGSNLVEYFLKDERISLVRVLDNLSNGSIENIQMFLNNPKFEFIKGDIRDYNTCLRACEGIDRISHQAALGSVPRSVENPMQTTDVNILGTVNIMYAAVQQKVERVILAFSSSTYGDHPGLPKVEENIGKPLSPYAVTKASIETFSDVFGRTYGLNWIGLRYFNVFGPKQSVLNQYSAVIPNFCKAYLDRKPCVIYGNGEASRDFTYVQNVVSINCLALFAEGETVLNGIYNVACGEKISLNDLIKNLDQIFGFKNEIKFEAERSGDVKHSLADITKAKRLLGYEPTVHFSEGLLRTVKWYEQNYAK